jgi:hypothetical protein
MSVVLDNGLEVTVVRNHFFFGEPEHVYLHVHGHSKAADLARKELPGYVRVGDEFAYRRLPVRHRGLPQSRNQKPIARAEKGSHQMMRCFRFLICLSLAATSLRSGSIDAASYAWSSTNGSGVSGNLSFKGKAKTLTFDTCPSGVVAGNLVYIYRGFGGSESAVIKAASCPPGKRGTVTIATRQAHLGKWMASTSTAGIQEAVAVLGFGGGEVLVGPGTFEVHSRITLTSNITLRGVGVDKTTLLVPHDEFKNSAPWQFGLYPSGTVILGPPGHSGITITGLSVKFSKQTLPPNGSYGIIFVDVTNSLIDAVAVRDGPILRKGNTFLPIGILGLSNNNTVQNSLVYNLPCSISSEGSGGFISGGKSNRFIHNYVSNGCNSVYIAGGFDILFEGNMFELRDSTMLPNAQAFAADNASGSRFLNNRCIGNGIAPACFSAVTDDKKPDTIDSTFIGNEARDCSQAFQFQSTVAHSRQIRVEGGSTVNCATPLSLLGIIDDLQITGVQGVRDFRTGRVVSIPVNSDFLHNVPTVGSEVVWMTDAASDYSVGGFKGGSILGKVQIVNATAHAMRLSQNDPTSPRESRICRRIGKEVVSPAESIVELAYSEDEGCWTVLEGVQSADQ